MRSHSFANPVSLSRAAKALGGSFRPRKETWILWDSLVVKRFESVTHIYNVIHRRRSLNVSGETVANHLKINDNVKKLKLSLAERVVP